MGHANFNRQSRLQKSTMQNDNCPNCGMGPMHRPDSDWECGSFVFTGGNRVGKINKSPACVEIARLKELVRLADNIVELHLPHDRIDAKRTYMAARLGVPNGK